MYGSRLAIFYAVTLASLGSASFIKRQEIYSTSPPSPGGCEGGLQHCQSANSCYDPNTQRCCNPDHDDCSGTNICPNSDASCTFGQTTTSTTSTIWSTTTVTPSSPIETMSPPCSGTETRPPGWPGITTSPGSSDSTVTTAITCNSDTYCGTVITSTTASSTLSPCTSTTISPSPTYGSRETTNSVPDDNFTLASPTKPNPATGTATGTTSISSPSIDVASFSTPASSPKPSAPASSTDGAASSSIISSTTASFTGAADRFATAALWMGVVAYGGQVLLV